MLSNSRCRMTSVISMSHKHSATSSSPKVLLVDEAAALLTSNATTLVEWTEQDRLPCARIAHAGVQYLVPLGVITELAPRLLAAWRLGYAAFASSPASRPRSRSVARVCI